MAISHVDGNRFRVLSEHFDGIANWMLRVEVVLVFCEENIISKYSTFSSSFRHLFSDQWGKKLLRICSTNTATSNKFLRGQISIMSRLTRSPLSSGRLEFIVFKRRFFLRNRSHHQEMGASIQFPLPLPKTSFGICVHV